MKKLLILFLFCHLGMIAQDNRHEKIKALKVAYITEELSLTTAEAEAFWPIYNKIDEQMHVLRKTERRDIYKKLKEGVENLSNEEANALIDKGLEVEEKMLKLHKELSQNLRKAIPPQKIIKLRKAEEDFKRELLERYKNRTNKKPKE